MDSAARANIALYFDAQVLKDTKHPERVEGALHICWDLLLQPDISPHLRAAVNLLVAQCVALGVYILCACRNSAKLG